MSERRLGLRAAADDPAPREALAAAHERVGLDGLLGGRGTRAVSTAVPAPAAGRGVRWSRRDVRDREWWPQGIDLQHRGDRLVAAVSWYFKPRGGREVATRVSFVDLRDPRRPRYHHVLLVEAVGEAERTGEGGVRMAPIAVHAGGIAWHRDELHVADTFGGLRVFRVDDILRVTRPSGLGAWMRRWRDRVRPLPRRRDAALGFDHVLPQSAGYTADTPTGVRRLRYSFVSLEHDAAAPHLVVGEYRNSDDEGRLVRLPIDPATGRVRASAEAVLELDDVHEPRVMRMQGVCVVDGTWYLTTSEGTRRNGDLWIGRPGDLVRHRGALPPGPEDLAREPGTARVWTLTEQPGRRWVFPLAP